MPEVKIDLSGPNEPPDVTLYEDESGEGRCSILFGDVTLTLTRFQWEAIEEAVREIDEHQWRPIEAFRVERPPEGGM